MLRSTSGHVDGLSDAARTSSSGGPELAVKREADHPSDSLPIYQREVDALLETKRNDGYEAAVTLLGRIRELMLRLDRPDDFPAYLTSVRAAHGRKRNFTKLLDKARW